MSRRSSSSVETEAPDLPARARVAAVRLFVRQGFEGTSLQQVADAVGVSKQALLYHFASKEGLRAAALAELVSLWRNALPRLLSALARPGGQPAPTIDDALENAFLELYEIARAEPAYPRFLLQELLRPADGTHPILHDIEPWVKLAADFIRKGKADGSIDGEVDPEAFIVNLGTSLLATLSLLDDRGLPGKPPPRRLLREMARIARSSLMTPR